MRATTTLALVFTLTIACTKPAADLAVGTAAADAALAKKHDADAARELEQRDADLKASAKRDVVANPNKYLQLKDMQYKDKGIINHYAQPNVATILNSSQFPVENLSASVEWIDARGTSLGTTPATLKGSIPSGATTTFSLKAGTMTSGTLQGAPAKYVWHWTHVDVVDIK